MITDLRLGMSSDSSKTQEPGVYVMESAAKAKQTGRKHKKSGIYVKQAKATARAIAGIAELTGKLNNETRAVCYQGEPVVCMVQAKMPTCVPVAEFNKKFNNEVESNQHEEIA